MKLNTFYETLEKYRKPKPSDPHDVGRINHCYLLHFHKNEPHIFEVRGWQKLEEELNISVVNWTLCAGTASLKIKEDLVDKFVIVPDSSEAHKIKNILDKYKK